MLITSISFYTKGSSRGETRDTKKRGIAEKHPLLSKEVYFYCHRERVAFDTGKFKIM